MSTEDSAVAHGYCQCGCGEKAPVAKYTLKAKGWVQGRPKRYVSGHNRRRSGAAYIVDPETGCWLWQRKRRPNGYGQVYDGARIVHAHRLYYERANGPIPVGLVVDHLCRNKSCVNPEHLEAVGQSTNTHRGNRSKLSWPLVERLAERHASGESYASLAREHGLSVQTVRRAVLGITWKR